jgi:glycosyltransferase involved in cell wall biosynthesis
VQITPYFGHDKLKHIGHKLKHIGHRMRILQISSASSFGGGERYVVDLVNALSARGHDLFVAVRPKSPLVQHLHLPTENIKTLPLRNALDPQSARALAKIVKEHKIDVVHAHMARDYSLAAYAVRRRPAKFVVTRHVLFPLNKLHSRILGRVHKIIAVSGAVARQLQGQRLVPDERIAVVHNGINVERFAQASVDFDRSSFLDGKNIPPDSLLVSSIGELRKLKRHDDFIRAAALVSNQVSNVHFVVAGVDTSPKGETMSELVQLVAELKLQGRVHFPGWLDDADKLLCATDVFVSTSETESFGLSIVEAMAAGLPVVTTRTEGAQEVVEAGATGLLVPIGDIEQIAGSICGLLTDATERRKLGGQAAVRARERFSLGRMVDEIEKIYLE